MRWVPSRGLCESLKKTYGCCRAIKKCDCFHANPDDPCTYSQTPWIILFGCLQLIFSQIQDIDR